MAVDTIVASIAIMNDAAITAASTNGRLTAGLAGDASAVMPLVAGLAENVSGGSSGGGVLVLSSSDIGLAQTGRRVVTAALDGWGRAPRQAGT